MTVMEKMGFEGKWMEWIKECISFVFYNIIVNGKHSRTSFPSRGIRQGDPLSPYLFLFVIDVLSRMINKSIESRSLISIKLGKDCPVLSHLLFVGDSLFFLSANKESGIAMKCILQKYCEGSDRKSTRLNSSHRP